MSTGGKLLNTIVDVGTLGGDRLLSSGGATGIVDSLSGQNGARATPQTIGEYDPAAEAQYKRDYDNWVAQQNWMRMQYAGHPQDMPNIPPPTPPSVDASAKRLYQDRAGQLGVAQDVQAGYRPLIGQLQQAAAGEGPSQAQNVLKEGTARAQAGAYSTAASVPAQGAQAAAAMTQAGQQAVGAQMQGARAAGQLRAQEMTDARAQLGASLSGMAGSAGTLYGNMASQDLARAQTNIGSQNTAQGLNVAVEGQNAANKQQFAKDVATTGGDLMAHSDIRGKRDIVPLSGGAAMAYQPVGTIGLGDQSAGEDAGGAYKRLFAHRRQEGGGSHILPNRDEPRGAPPPGQAEPPAWTRVHPDPENFKRAVDAFSAAQEKYISRTGIPTYTPLQFDEASGSFQDDPYPGANMDGMPATVGYRSTYSPALPSALTQPGDNAAAFGSQPASMIVSDEHSKDKIRALEGQLAEAKLGLDTQAGQIRGTQVDYPKLGLGDGTREALSTVEPYQYRYKPDTAARIGEDTGPRIGIMAQDLERSPNPAVRNTVIDTPQGKAIDGRRGLSLALASSAGLDKRIGAIEDALSQPTQYPTLGRGAYR